MNVLKKIWNWITIEKIAYFINAIMLFLLVGFGLWYRDNWGTEQCYIVNWESFTNNLAGMMMFWVAGYFLGSRDK